MCREIEKPYHDLWVDRRLRREGSSYVEVRPANAKLRSSEMECKEESEQQCGPIIVAVDTMPQLRPYL